jgi:DNA-binding response OmpR family regulator
MLCHNLKAMRKNNMKKNILILEDEIILLGLLQRRLTAEGFVVSAAQDGESGLEMMKKTLPDLVLLDIVMPQKDGIEVLKEKSKDEKIKNIPVIIISNSGQAVELEKIKSFGVRDWLIKTEFDPQEVVEKVKKVFS